MATKKSILEAITVGGKKLGKEVNSWEAYLRTKSATLFGGTVLPETLKTVGAVRAGMSEGGQRLIDKIEAGGSFLKEAFGAVAGTTADVGEDFVSIVKGQERRFPGLKAEVGRRVSASAEGTADVIGSIADHARDELRGFPKRHPFISAGARGAARAAKETAGVVNLGVAAPIGTVFSHPGPVMLGIGAVSLAGVASPFVGKAQGALDAQAYEQMVGRSYSPQEEVLQQARTMAVHPSPGTGPSPSLNDRFMNSTMGLVQGLHAQRVS